MEFNEMPSRVSVRLEVDFISQITDLLADSQNKFTRYIDFIERCTTSAVQSSQYEALFLGSKHSLVDSVQSMGYTTLPFPKMTSPEKKKRNSSPIRDGYTVYAVTKPYLMF